MIAVASAFSNNDDDDIAEALMAIEHDDLLLSSAMAESNGADRRGLLPERSPIKLRDFACGERGILRDCFGLDGRPLIYYKKVFERRVPLPRIVFDRVYRDVLSVLCFHQRVSATKKMQSYTLQKVAAALRVLVSGFPADEVDEYARLSDSTINETVHRFTRNILEKYKPNNLREPIRADLQGVKDDYADVGFPGCMGCGDCFHWDWRICPVALHGQYQGK